MIGKYAVLFVFNVLLASCAQVILKISANKKHSTKINEYLNPYVIGAYLIFVINTLVSIYCYRYLELKQGGILQMFGYVFVLIFDRVFFKGEITHKKILGVVMIITGIIVFYVI